MLDAFATKHELLQPCNPPFSFFQLIDSVAPPHPQCAAVPLHRFFSLMRKMGAQSFLQEELCPNAELLSEHEMLAEAKALAIADISMKVVRITVFRALPSDRRWETRKGLADSDLLGYAVVISFEKPASLRCSYLYEAGVTPPSMIIRQQAIALRSKVSNYYIHNCRALRTSIGTPSSNRTLRFVGSYFAQQNGITHVCAHAALRMAVNSSPHFSSRPKLTNKIINSELKLSWKDVPNGLDEQQMKQVIEAIGGSVQLADFRAKPAMEYDQFVYPLMESNCPVILNVHGRRFTDRSESSSSLEIGHALAVMGHTINTDRWEPEARGGYGSYPRNSHLPAAAWTDHLIISDDNFGMHVTLPCDSLRNFIIPDKNPGLHAAVAMGIVPRSVRLWGYMAEQRAARWFKDGITHSLFTNAPYWLDKLIDGPLVCRTVLQRRRDYLQHVRDLHLALKKVLDPAVETDILALPARLWVVELSLPHLYAANRHKVGEVLLDAGATQRRHSLGKSLVGLRLPGCFAFFTLGKSCYLPITEHVPLITDEPDEERLCDW